MNRRSILSTIPALFAAGCAPGVRLPIREEALPQVGFEALRAYCGVYRLDPEHTLGVDRFINDSGEEVLLWTDHRSGAVRRLFQDSTDEFSIGAGIDVRDPVEQTLGFKRDDQNRVVGLTVRPVGGAEVAANRMLAREEEVSFHQGGAALKGTLILPEGPGPHPAIVLLHGSGPLTRYSFGPYPRCFNALGLAVLVFDKRGTGKSTGQLLDASTGAPDMLWPAFFPDDLLADAIAAANVLRTRPEIDPGRIGFWGSSEGGMLSTQTAAQSPEVAFAINSSGFMGPLWQTLLYQAERNLKATSRYSEDEIKQALEFNRFALDVARTGEGFEDFLKRRKELVRSGKEDWLTWYIGEYTSLAQMRWSWDHILSFDPLPALSKVKCPTLGVFGQFDLSTDPTTAPIAMHDALLAADNPDVTVRVIANASHSLMEKTSFKEPPGNRMAPGVFDLLRKWLLDRVG